MTPLHVSFAAGWHGAWTIERITPVTGGTLDLAPRLAVVEGAGTVPDDAIWVLRGVTSNERYVERPEREALAATQPPLGRPDSIRAALIPVQKAGAWWELTQDERRAIFEARSHHIAVGLEYLPMVARRLHHSRDLSEPCDFLTWFEFAPRDEPAFDELVARLRATVEWEYVERELDIRLGR